MGKIRVLNLYAGIGGNRKLWDSDKIEVTAVENVPEIAKVYQDFFPNDKVVIADAHQYLLEHYQEFDFIWSSPPCPTHSQIRQNLGVLNGTSKPVYPEMELYQEIIFLMHNFKGMWVVENTVSYYDPLIKPQEVAGHYYWANFKITDIKTEKREHRSNVDVLQERKGFNLDNVKLPDKREVLRNCVEPEVGLHIFNMAWKNKQAVLPL